MRILLALVFLAFFSGIGEENPCDDPAIFGEPPSRVRNVVMLGHLATSTREEPRLVWHCGTPDPPPPLGEALSAAVRGAVTLRAPHVGYAAVPESGR